MAALRQMFDGISTLKAGTAAIALSTLGLGGCAGLPGMQAGPTIIAGTHMARNDVAVSRPDLHNGWQVDPTNTVTLAPIPNRPVPAIRSAGVTLKYPLSAAETQIVEQCFRTQHANFHSQCLSQYPSAPQVAVFELSPQLVYAQLNCQPRPQLFKNIQVPGTGNRENYVAYRCGVLPSSYDVKSPYTNNQRLRIQP